MCDSRLIIDNKLSEPEQYYCPVEKHALYHKDKVLLSDFDFGGDISYAAIHKIENAHGVKSGYMIIIGD